MMSPRHTLRWMIRKGKKVDKISIDDIRCFEKESITDKDIAVCMDVSESMKEGLKLCYAKLVAAGVAKTTRSLLQKGNATNQKQIIIISDRLPNISSEEEIYFQTGDEQMESYGVSTFFIPI